MSFIKFNDNVVNIDYIKNVYVDAANEKICLTMQGSPKDFVIAKKYDEKSWKSLMNELNPVFIELDVVAA